MRVCDLSVVSMVSHEAKIGTMSYLVCSCTTFSARILLFDGVQWSFGVKGVRL